MYTHCIREGGNEPNNNLKKRENRKVLFERMEI
jgi:hypothetical protein